MDVLITGAGPTGLALACGLRLHGVGVRVIDQAPGPATTSRALILNARGVEVLDRLSALGDLPTRALSAIKTTFHFAGRTLTLHIGEVAGAGRAALVISQAEIEAELRRRLADLGVNVEWDTSLTGATPDPTGVTATLEGGQQVRTGWLVGCDGAHSTVRKLAGIGFPGVKLAERFLLADVHATWAGADRTGTAAWFHRDGAVLAFPLRDVGGAQDLWRLVADLSLAEDQELDTPAIVEQFRRLLPERTGLRDVRITEAVWASTFHLHRRLADRYRHGRLLLAGDAAHIHSLIGGQGMNTAIGDAENLAFKLALVTTGRAAEGLLDTYQAERRPLATEVLRGTSAATRLLFDTGPLMRLLLDRVVIPLVDKPRVQQRITAAGTQLNLTYRRGPLAAGSPRRRSGPRPGDRVPDWTCRHQDGTPSRLHAELGGRWALLVADTDAHASVEMARKHLGQHAVVVLTATDAPGGEVLLVRPDAHLARRGQPDAAKLDRWLQDALQHGQTRRWRTRR